MAKAGEINRMGGMYRCMGCGHEMPVWYGERFPSCHCKNGRSWLLMPDDYDTYT